MSATKKRKFNAAPENRNVKEINLYEGKFIRLKGISYKRANETKNWESAERTSKKGSVDAVHIVAIYKERNCPDKIVVLKQYRPPVAGITIELPAGLLDKANESPETTALRELKEETGFQGTVLNSTIITAVDPGFSNCTHNIVFVEIEADLEENKKAHPEEGEYIDVELVELDSLMDKLQKFHQDGFIIDSTLFTYALGLNSSHNSKEEK